MKTEVYSWRLSRGLKSDLERAARARKVRIAHLLETAVREWLAKNAADISDDEEQKRLHAAAARFFGVLSSGRTADSKRVRETIRKNLTRKYAR
jgi:post-segregation antitoxin (ccd killing protein)